MKCLLQSNWMCEIRDDYCVKIRYSETLLNYQRRDFVKRLLKFSTVACALSMSAVIFAGTIPSAASPTPVPPQAPQPAAPQFTADQVTQLHQIIRDYLVSNPNVLVQASQALQAQQEQKMQSVAIAAIQNNKTELFDDSNSPTLGSKTAAATLVEFYDYQCGHCKQMAPIIEKLIGSDKNLHVIFKELPIFGENSKFAAEAALASEKQGKFYVFHNLLLSSNSALTKEKVMQLAKHAGLNIAKLKLEMRSPAIDNEIRANFKLAQALQLVGTPTFVISNEAKTSFRYIPGGTSLDELQKQIQAVG
ncbi:MAG: outer membrane protein [uncultured bacterium]|nr:MAG: outer membrane protein [uncultured bacterium]